MDAEKFKVEIALIRKMADMGEKLNEVIDDEPKPGDFTKAGRKAELNELEKQFIQLYFDNRHIPMQVPDVININI